jgi:hypothetical protein
MFVLILIVLTGNLIAVPGYYRTADACHATGKSFEEQHLGKYLCVPVDYTYDRRLSPQ